MNVELFTAIPNIVQSDRQHFVNELKRIARQSEKYNFRGVLVYSDNSLADPWLVTSLILSETEKLLPMIALQPVYMHPYTVAKKIASIALIHERQIALNLVAGGFVNDLKALGDQTEHDRRYDRLREYTQIIQKLLASDGPVTFDGEFYQVKNLKLTPEIPESLRPLYYLSGSSSAARETADTLGARLIQYPEPKEEFSQDNMNGGDAAKGIRIGILTRPSHDEAWSDAFDRFPETRIGELAHQLAKNISDSEWHKRLSRNGENSSGGNGQSVYWLGPFNHYHTFCPYLVGDFSEVADEISAYLKAGCTTCILDTPVSEFELENTLRVFNRADAQIHTAL